MILNREIFPITLGTMTFGTPVAFEDAVALTRGALERGVNHIDTANMYEGYARYAGSAGGVAERIVGEAIRPFRREEILRATKVGMKVGPEPEDDGTSPAAIEKQLNASLKRLKTDYVDLYYLHRPDTCVAMEEILEAMAAQIKAGKILGYGISNYSGEQLRNLLQTAERCHFPKPVVCQPPLSLLKQEAYLDLLPELEKAAIEVIPYQIFQGGLLTGKYHRGMQPPAGSRAAEKPEWVWAMDDHLFDKLEGFEAAAAKERCSLYQYAIRWTLRQKQVASVIVGVKNIQQLEDAIAAIR